MTQLFMAHPGPLQLPGPDVPPDFTLRVGTTCDAAALSVLLEEAFAEPWSVERVESTLLTADDVVQTWVVTSADTIVGTASERLLPVLYPVPATSTTSASSPAHVDTDWARSSPRLASTASPTAA